MRIGWYNAVEIELLSKLILRLDMTTELSSMAVDTDRSYKLIAVAINFEENTPKDHRPGSNGVDGGSRPSFIVSFGVRTNHGNRGRCRIACSSIQRENSQVEERGSTMGRLPERRSTQWKERHQKIL